MSEEGRVIISRNGRFINVLLFYESSPMFIDVNTGGKGWDGMGWDGKMVVCGLWRVFLF